MKLNIDRRGYDNIIVRPSVCTYTKTDVRMSSSVHARMVSKLCSVVSRRPSTSSCFRLYPGNPKTKYTQLSFPKNYQSNVDHASYRSSCLSKERGRLCSLTVKDSVGAGGHQRRHLKISLANNSMNMRVFVPKQRMFPKVSCNVGPLYLPPGCALSSLIFGLLVCYSTSEPLHAEASRDDDDDDDCDSSYVNSSHVKKVYTDYTITGIPGDRRCMFRSVAHGACLRSGEPAPTESRQRELADELRARVADEFIKRREETEWFVEGDFDTYVMEMRKPHVWGGEPELFMASHVLRMPITVYMHDREAGGLISIAEYGQEYGKKSPIRVLYHGFGHYDALQIPEKMVLLQEQRDEFKPLLRLHKEDKTSQSVLNRRQADSEPLIHEEKNPQDPNRLVWEFDRPSVHWPGFWHIFPSVQKKVNLSLLPTTKSSTSEDSTKESDAELSEVVELAKKALLASREAVSLAEVTKLVGADSDDTRCLSLAGSLRMEDKTVRSTRCLGRRSKRRKVPKSNFSLNENYRSTSSRAQEVKKKLVEGLDSDDLLRLFLASPESKQLLTLAEESEMVRKVQDLMKLEQVKSRLQSEFGREPTLIEWAEAVGVSCRTLQTQVRTGTTGREKLIYANLRMVVHIAKQYQGRGVGIQDLMQEGSMGLMRSVEKFRPQAGCRFATYAYWWIRQTVRKAIFQHSRTIRLPENMYTLLGKVLEAKRAYIQEGNRSPSQEELAKRVGITVPKLEKLLFSTRMPVSIQRPVWDDQKTTFQEITADPGIETPELTVTKQLMRKKVRDLLRVLNPREQQIIRLRFGIADGSQKSLSEIGRIYGLSKERVRQLESRALHKLRQCSASQDLVAYSDLLI